MKDIKKSREDQIVDRIKESLTQDGYSPNKVYHKTKDGMGTAKSYFDALVDLKLEGRDYPNAQEVWEEMKTHINYLTGELLRSSEEYSKLEKKIRGLEEDNRNLIRSK